MLIKLLIAAGDCDYTEHLSAVITENHADAIDVSVCSSASRLREILAVGKFDAALLEASMIDNIDLQPIHIPLLLRSEDDDNSAVPEEFIKVRKYQRVSSMVSDILDICARQSKSESGAYIKRAYITAVWSPAGGVGKTTAALAYCAGKALTAKQVLYLNLEAFSSTGIYFVQAGRSISSVFEILESGEGNVKMQICSARKQDSDTGITYFSRPDNFDDMNILTSGNISALIGVCCEVADELVIDMSCVCDERARTIFERADKILLVTDPTNTALIKIRQFMSQHDTFQRIKGKMRLVANKGAVVSIPEIGSAVSLPMVQSTDATAVYKTLVNYFPNA